MLQTKIDLGMAVTEQINRQQRGVLRDADDSLAKSPYLSKDIFKNMWCGRNPFVLSKEVMHLLKETHVS